MNFNIFINQLEQALKSENPGLIAHETFYPSNRKIELKHKTIIKKAAVLIICYPDDANQTRVVMIKRADFGVHGNQIAFPGGKFEEQDKNLFNTALRETEEEIGISKRSIKIIHELSAINIPISQTKMIPFVGYALSKLKFKLNEEVQQTLEIPLDFIMNLEKHIRTDLTVGGVKDIPYIKFDKQKIWGASAMALNELKEVLKRKLKSL